MPACITHQLFAERVARLCAQRGFPVYDRDMLALGSQGPDVFFFHRAFPWQRGARGFAAGQAMHKGSPATLLTALRESMHRETVAPDQVKGYMQGFLCHYALDRKVHPFVLYWQEELRRQQPRYGQTPSQYHFRIESALDTRTLRRDTGRRIQDYSLTALVPQDREGRYAAFARLYLPVFRAYLHQPEITMERLMQAPGDMREAMFWMTDRHGCRRALLRGGELLLGKGPLGTSLLRPAGTDDWDYANEAHREWHNPHDPTRRSTAGFDELFEEAAAEAVTMIAGFFAGDDMMDITGDRGFSSDLPGVYDNKER